MNDAAALSASDHALMQIVYNLMRRKGTWPTFTTVDVRADRELGIEDAQAVLAALPATLIFRSWHAHGFYDNDEVRLRLAGIDLCDGGPEDLALLVELVSWVVGREREDESGAEEDLVVTAQEFADHVGLVLEPSASSRAPSSDRTQPDAEADEQPVTAPVDAASPAGLSTASQAIIDGRAKVARVRLLAELLPTFWTGAGWQTDQPWTWRYTVDRRRLRPYRRRRSLADLLDYTDEVERERLTATAALTRSALTYTVTEAVPGFDPTGETGEPEPASGIAVTGDSSKKYTYDASERLGGGRFSTVYGGRDDAGTPVAVKRLAIRGDSTRHRDADLQQAERELQVAARVAAVAGSHIMPVWDAAHGDGELLIVMPRAEYSAADLIVRQGGLGNAGAKELVRQVALAMQELANVAVVHRDIKPGNILWHEGRWRLADFGISRITTTATATYTFHGTATLEYLAPESWGFGPQTVSSDLYALGCTGYEAVTGRKAFEAELHEHANHVPVLPADTDPVLAKVIHLLLAKNPEQRPVDARRVLELLAPRDGLTEGQRSLQRLIAAAAERTVQRGSEEAALMERHRRQQRARIALSALWRDLLEHVREAVPEADSNEDVDNLVDSRTLIVADARLRVRLDDSPRSRPSEALLVAELHVSSIAQTHPRRVANLVCFWRDDHPEWHLAQFTWRAIAGSNLPAEAVEGPGGLPPAAAYDPWDTPVAEETATVVSDVVADPNTIIELFTRELVR